MNKDDLKDKDFLPDYTEIFEDAKHDGNVTSKLLRSLLKSNFKELVISMVLYFIKYSPELLTPVFTANIIDIATYPSSHSVWEIAINGVILAVLIIQNLFTGGFLWTDYTSKMLRNIGVGLRNSLIKKLQQLSLTYHNELKSGALQSKFIRDAEAIEQFIRQLVVTLLPLMMTVCLTVGITISKSRIVALFFLIIIPVNVGVIMMFRKKMGHDNYKFRKENETVSAQITTMIEMIPVTKSHGLEDTEIEKMEKELKNLKSAGMSLDHSQGIFGAAAWVTSKVMSAICLVFTGYLAYIGKLSVGSVVLFQSYFGTISAQVQALLNIYPEFTKGAESIKSVSEIMISDRIEDNRNKIKLRYVHGTVQFKDVFYKYPNSDKMVIKNFSLDVEPGDCVAVVGGSGSGKSTLMNMIIGALRPTKGEVWIDGKPLGMLNLQDYRHFISVVPQNCILFSGSIKDNILYGINKYDEKYFEKVLDLANIREFTDRLPDGIDTIVEEHGGNLSGGQKQRISIARALMRDPKIIILDEATSALDNISERHIQEAMTNLIKGRTTFIVAHRLSTIRDANKIVVMENGECVEMGTQEELMAKRGKFYELKNLT